MGMSAAGQVEQVTASEDINLKDALVKLSGIVGVESNRMNSIEGKISDLTSKLEAVMNQLEGSVTGEKSTGSGSASGIHMIAGKKLDQMDGVQRYTYADLMKFTNNFSDQNFIERTQFCKVYRGKILEGCNETAGQDVTVKIWADKLDMNGELAIERVVANNIHRFRDELSFLKNYPHPNLVKLKGSCFEGGKMGVVYELNSLDSLRNLIAEDTLKWLDRIKILVQFALLMEWFHDKGPQYLVRNLSAAHIMIDKDLNPILFEFGMLASCASTGETKLGRHCFPTGAFGYIDPATPTYRKWSVRADVFAFGVLILELLCKRQVDEFENVLEGKCFFLYLYANEVHERSKKPSSGISLYSLVSKGLTRDPEFDKDDAAALMELGNKCASRSKDAYERPTMVEVVHHLKSLLVVQTHRGFAPDANGVS